MSPGVTLRSVALSCALIPLMAMWVVSSSFVWASSYSTAISLFFHVTFTVFALAVVNIPLKRMYPRHALTPAELMTIYAMLAVAGTLCSMDFIQVLIPMIAYPDYAANAQNRYGTLILEHIPDWAILKNRDAQTAAAVGNASIYRADFLKAWARPLAFWGMFILALFGALAAINLFVRHHWTEKERLAFPVLVIPLTIASKLEETLRTRLFWIGFAIAFSISGINAINFHYPSFPSIPTYRVFVFGDYFEERPWDALAMTYININPFIIGLAFLIPTDLLFSCWFFYVFFRLQMVVTSALGLEELPRAPYPQEQAAGGYFAVGLLAIWATRRHLGRVARRVLGLPGGADDSREPMPYRATALLFLVCCGILFFSMKALGATATVVLVFLVIFFVYAIAIARMRAELGPPAHDLHYMGPDTIIHTAVGGEALGQGNAGALSLSYWFNRAYRGHFSAHSLEMLKAAQVQRWSGLRTVGAMALAVVVGLAAAYWATLHALNVHGYGGRIAGNAFSSEAWVRMASWTDNPVGPDGPALVAIGGGLLFALLLGFLRLSFTSFPFHPVGYATATSWSMDQLWFGLFVAWTLKLAIVRYGGAKAYNTALPFFIGLVLGEFTIGSFLSIPSALFGYPTYCFWGN